MTRVDSNGGNNTNNQQDDIPPELDTRYRLVYLTAQRTKQLQRGAALRINVDPLRHKPTRIALEELIRGKVKFVRNEGQSNLPAQKLVPNQQFIALALIGERIKLVSLSPDGQYKFLDEKDYVHDLIHALPLEAADLRDSIEELEALVNSPKAKEKDFQDFFNRHRDFILNDEYKDAHPHIGLTSDDGQALVPDFILEPIDQGGLCDLLELKLPSAKVFNLKKNRMRYSAAVAEAAAQLRLYGRYFEEEKNRNDLFERYRLRAYKPKMFVIIGRRSHAVDAFEERSMQTDLPNLYLRTYDDIINRMKWRAERMKTRDKVRLT